MSNLKLIPMLVVCALILAIVAFSGVSAALPPAPTIPALPSTSSGGSSSGGGSSGSSSAPVFQPYTVLLHSSDGSVIGSLAGKSEASVLVAAGKNGTAGKQSYYVTVACELSMRPPGEAWLDITYVDPDHISLPEGLAALQPLAAVNITHYSSWGWNLKDGTFTLGLNLSESDVQALNSSCTYYLLWPNGDRYVLQKVVPASTGDGSFTFTIKPAGDSGQFILLEVKDAAPSPSPSPASTPATVPAITATPVPTTIVATEPVSGVIIGLVAFVVGAILGAAAIFAMRMRKGKP